MAPGIALTVVFVDRVSAVIIHPGPGAFAALAPVTAAVVGAAVFVWRRLGGRTAVATGKAE